MPTEAQALLIRLIMHPKNNPHLIDKLIILRGLPYEWVFKKSKFKIEHEDGTIEEGVGDNLLTPWEADADVNIPREVRDLTEPITFLHWFPGGANAGKSFNGFWNKRTVWGLRIDFSHGPSQELWNKIEEFMDKSLGRGEKMPEAVQVAKDQKSEFKTFLARRGKTLSSLEMVEMDVPIVDLRTKVLTEGTITIASSPELTLKTVITVPVNPAPPTPEPPKNGDVIYTCDVCQKVFDKPRALSMHKLGAHRREKVKV